MIDINSIRKHERAQRRIILLASTEFLLATMALFQIHLDNALHDGIRILFLIVFAATSAFGYRLLFGPAASGVGSKVPVLQSPTRELLRISISLITLPAILYVGYGEFLIALDSKFCNTYVEKVLEYAEKRRRLEGDKVADDFIRRAGEAQGKRAERLELTRQWSISHYETYVELMRHLTKDSHFGLGVMARIYDKIGDTQKAEALYAENHYRFHVSTPQTPAGFALLEARLLDVLRYIPEKEAMAKIWWMPKVIDDKNASALKLGLTWLPFDFRSNIYDLRGVDRPIGFEEKRDFPIMCKDDVEWLLATIGKERVSRDLPMMVPLCPDWKTSDFVFEYGVIPPIAFDAQRIPDVFMNGAKENKAPLSWRVPQSLAASLPHEEVILPMSLCKKLLTLAGEPDGLQRRIEEGHIYFLDRPISYEEAKLSERAYYKKIIRLGAR
ncbi:MAG: hypothetical protein K2Y39_05325 [Candidatus Obscuribacterales bacterium]|nr:hypothetical protein [Candidatus Obscuribacterales bacterium]